MFFGIYPTIYFMYKHNLESLCTISTVELIYVGYKFTVLSDVERIVQLVKVSIYMLNT